MYTHPISEPFITICRQLNLDLRAYLNIHATRPQLPASLLSGSISTQLPRVARTGAARAAIDKAAAAGKSFRLLFPALSNHPEAVISWRFSPLAGNVLTAHYSINTPPTCAQCRFCHPVTDLPPDAPNTCAFCDCPPSAGGDGIAYAIHTYFNTCQHFQPKTK